MKRKVRPPMCQFPDASGMEEIYDIFSAPVATIMRNLITSHNVEGILFMDGSGYLVSVISSRSRSLLVKRLEVI